MLFFYYYFMQSQDNVESSSSESIQPNQQQEQKKPQQENIISKKQLKKLIKKEKWEKEKPIKRQQKRNKQKEKKKAKKLLQNTQHQKQSVKVQPHLSQSKLITKRKDDYRQKIAAGLKVVIDLQFYDLMVEKQKNSLIKQLSYCHSVNRRQQKCFNYILTSTTPQRLKTLSDRYNADKWGINIEASSLLELFPKQKIVYLTGDASEDIEEFDPEMIYVIGGIVDHNRLKKLTFNFAEQNGITAKRLPMGNVHLKASVHLAVNHVWQWMLKKYNGATWQQAVKSVIPTRKLQEHVKEQV